MASLARSAFALILFASAVPIASAQERIELFTNVDTIARSLDVDATVSGFGTVRRTSPASNSGGSTPIALAGGRYLVWIDGDGLALFDRRTRRSTTVGLASTIGPPVDLVADRRQPRVFVTTLTIPWQIQVWVIDARAPQPRLLYSTSDVYHAMAYAPAADELFVNSAAGGGVSPLAHATDVIDVASGAIARRLVRSDWLDDIQVSDDGRFMWGLTSPFSIGNLDLVDGLTGATLARGPVVRPPLALDPDRRLLLAVEGYDEFLVALDALTMAEQWRSRVDLPGLARGHYATNQVLPGRWMTGAYVVHVENRNDGICQRIDVAAIDPDGSRRTTAQLLPFVGTGHFCRAIAVLVRSPFAPAGLSASVAGGAVALSWSDPGDTSEFELEYGLAPGQRLGAVRVGQTSQVTIPGVPPGVYYVRVIAHNEVGPSPPSNEVRVVVQ